MNAFFYPLNRGINFAKIREFKVTDYTLALVGRSFHLIPLASGPAKPGRGTTVSL